MVDLPNDAERAASARDDRTVGGDQRIGGSYAVADAQNAWLDLQPLPEPDLAEVVDGEMGRQKPRGGRQCLPPRGF